MESAAAMKNTLLAWLAAVGSVLATALGGWDQPMKLLGAMMVADYVTGVLLAAVWHKSKKSENGGLSSVAGMKGLLKKCVILLMVWLGCQLDRALGADYVRVMVILFFSGNEGISLLENLGLMGVPFPEFLVRMLEALRDEGNAGGGEGNNNKSGGSNAPGEE